MARAGLEARSDWFWIDGKKTRLFSGAMHYFRIPREYWRDRLVKLRACGCNALETYVPWNLHEPKRGVFDFDEMLDIRAFIKLAEECGLYVIARPGPYICSEWDLGGLPSWLLRDPDMKLRTNYEPYMAAVRSYFKELLPRLTDLQYSSGGGPIIAWQIENEYGTFSRSTEHLQQLQQVMLENGCTELMFTSDNEQGLMNGPVGDVLMMANFQNVDLGKEMLAMLKDKQPGMPRMCMEFWTGWFDHWGDKSHQVWPLDTYVAALDYILKEYGSVNFYMFHGGTNFGFMNGANEQTENDQLQSGQDYMADVTSYDYDALLTETGATTPKYDKTKDMLSKYSSEVVYLGSCPPLTQFSAPVKYDSVQMESCLPMETILKLVASCEMKGEGVAMEMLPFNDENGQSYGWTLYRRACTAGRVEVEGQVRDRTQVFLDGELVCTFDCNTADYTFTLPTAGVLSLLIENMGRSNYQPIDKNVLNAQRKGLSNRITVNGELMSDWTIYCLDFTNEMLEKLNKAEFGVWDGKTTPALFKGHLEVTDERPADTLLDMDSWGKGIVIVNGRNLGRYWPATGPTQTIYVPGPWLKAGRNEFLVFEIESAQTTLTFTDTPRLG